MLHEETAPSNVCILGAWQVELLAEALNLGDRTGVARDAVVAIVEQLFPGAIIPGAAGSPQGHAYCVHAGPGECSLWSSSSPAPSFLVRRVLGRGMRHACMLVREAPSSSLSPEHG